MAEFHHFLRGLKRRRAPPSNDVEAEDDFVEDKVLAARINAAGTAASIYITWKGWPASMGSWQDASDYLEVTRFSKRVKRYTYPTRSDTHVLHGRLLELQFEEREPVSAAARVGYWMGRANAADAELLSAAVRVLQRTFHAVLSRAVCERGRKKTVTSSDPLMRIIFGLARPGEVVPYNSAQGWPTRNSTEDFSATRVIEVLVAH